MPTRDPYQLLGVPRGASGNDIRMAYRRLARKHHPDANLDDPRAEERFKEIQQAYEVLSDVDKRRKQDERLRASSRRSHGGSRVGTGNGPTNGNISDVNLGDLLAKLSGLSDGRASGHKKSGGRLRGNDVTRITRLLGVDVDQLSKLLGEVATMRADVTFESGGRRTSGTLNENEPGEGLRAGSYKKPPIPRKPPKPPKTS